MSILYDQLIFISKCALNNLEYEEAIDNIKELFRLARENGLSGLFYAVLKNNQSVIDEQRLLLKEYYLYQAKDIIQKQAIAGDHLFFNHARSIISISRARPSRNTILRAICARWAISILSLSRKI